MNEQEIHAEALEKGLNAPRVLPEHIDDVILYAHYHSPADTLSADFVANHPDVAQSLRLLTQCTIVMLNGFTVTGESACASAENYNAELGRKVAYDNARKKIWPLMGFLLKEHIRRTNLEAESHA